ncbi:MAG: FtsQ-type POTRA domain-containing protein [Desulfobacterales bacterium]|nr:FtsQ-type POTRA domain-containing protein [Desulfobacterales bacterium]
MLGNDRIRRNRARPRRKKTGIPVTRVLVVGLRLTVALLGLICLSLSYIFVYDVMTQCDFFRSKEIRILGATRLTKQQVLLQAGIAPNMNILSVNLHLTRKRLLCHPWIAEAQVTRELPDHIIIHIRENEPLAVLNLGKKFIINTDGEIFKEWAPSDSVDLPLVTGLSFSDIRLPSDNGSPAFNALMTALYLGQEKGSVLPNRFIRRIHVDPDLGLTLYAFADEKAVKLGYRSYREKLRCLSPLLYRLNQQPEWMGFDAIDLANLNRVVVNPRTGRAFDGDFKEGFGAGT